MSCMPVQVFGCPASFVMSSNAALRAVFTQSVFPARWCGLIIMNGGSQRKGIGEQITEVTIIDENGNMRY